MQGAPHILIVDDHREIRDLVSRALSKEGFRVSTAADGRAMRKILADSRIDLILLDLMLPGEDGLSLCRALRAESNIPIIMLTAKGEEVDRVIGLEMGADDYLPKPFGSRELIARIKAVLRRSQERRSKGDSEQRPKSYHFDRWGLDTGSRALLRDDGVTVPLSTGEYDLLIALVERPQRVLNRDQLLDLARGRSAAGLDRSIDTQVSRLRKKLETRSQRPENHQDSLGWRLHVHACGDPQMNRLLPKSLFGQTLLIFLAGLIVSHARRLMDLHRGPRTGRARGRRIRRCPAHRQSDPARPGSAARMARTDRRRLERSDLARVTLGSASDDRGPERRDAAVAQAIKEFLIDQLSLAPDAATARVGIARRTVRCLAAGRPMMGRRPDDAWIPRLRGSEAFAICRSRCPFRMDNGSRLRPTFPTAARHFRASSWSRWRSWRSSFWGVDLGGAPRDGAFGRRVAAAERLGRDVNAPPLPETGTIETRQASRAFNNMQARLRNLIENRTRMLAAISHDLRTPLTLLRLRAENVEDQQERDKMLATIAEMDSMIGETLKFARDEATSEPRHPTDISALLQSIVDDMSDAGLSVQMQPAEPIVYECRPDAFKRALTNLIDNAVKYGKAAHVAIQTDAEDDRNHHR